MALYGPGDNGMGQRASGGHLWRKELLGGEAVYNAARHSAAGGRAVDKVCHQVRLRTLFCSGERAALGGIVFGAILGDQ